MTSQKIADAQGIVKETLERLEAVQAQIGVAKSFLRNKDLFWDIVQNALDVTGITAEEFAAKMKVANSTMSRWINRENAPRPQSMFKKYGLLSNVLKRRESIEKTLNITTRYFHPRFLRWMNALLLRLPE